MMRRVHMADEDEVAIPVTAGGAGAIAAPHREL